MAKQAPVLVTLTAPTCAGKSFLFNYIRDEAQMPCLISTTTRAPRAGEIEGRDYYFIDEATSKSIEDRGGFAELAIYRGVRYGVTQEEFHSKLNQGVAFLIVEPTGIDHYVKPALDAGALHLKYYVHTDTLVRLERFKQRLIADVHFANIADTNMKRMGKPAVHVEKTLNTHVDRLVSMLTEELKWGTSHHWTRTLFGDHRPEDNLKIILDDVKKAQDHAAEVAEHLESKDAVRINRIIDSWLSEVKY